MKFILAIDLGNDAMCTARDVAAALRQVAGNLSNAPRADMTDNTHGISGRIYDDNGNRVGGWHVEE